MKEVDQMPEFRANLPKSSHVLSHEFDFTCTTAHLLPIFHTIMNPGEKIQLGFDFNLRTMPLESAAFGDIETHTEYFFVPMQLLFQPFSSVYYGVVDNFSSAFTNTSNYQLPLIDFDKVVTALYTNRANAAQVAYPGVAASAFESVGQSAVRLFDMFGFNPVGICVPDVAGYHFYNPNVFPYQFLAYQCIYQYHYRLDNREIFDHQTFNLDKYYQTNNPIDIVSLFSGWQQIFTLRYRPLSDDYFTDAKVSPIIDVLNMNYKTSLPLADSWLSRNDVNNYPVIKSGYEGLSSPNYLVDAPNSTSQNPSTKIQTNFGFSSRYQNSSPLAFSSQFNGLDINTANIRALFANEKLWSITGRAKKNYDDQTLAHFGFQVPHDVKHQISKFGHDRGSIHIGEVISTASTTQAPLGEIAGKGYGVLSGKRHTFVAPCHGVVMAIFSVVSRHNYEAGILKANMVASRNDLFVPEYDHLGMQPIFGYECIYMDSATTQASNVLGWQYRYEQWKRRYNRTTGAFRNSVGSLKSWVPTYIPYAGSYADYWTLVKSDNLPNNPSHWNFLNMPTDVNQIMLGQYPNVWSSAYEDEDNWAHIYDMDPFVVNGFVNAVLVSTMSDYSLPRLDA